QVVDRLGVAVGAARQRAQVGHLPVLPQEGVEGGPPLRQVGVADHLAQGVDAVGVAVGAARERARSIICPDCHRNAWVRPPAESACQPTTRSRSLMAWAWLLAPPSVSRSVMQ